MPALRSETASPQFQIVGRACVHSIARIRIVRRRPRRLTESTGEKVAERLHGCGQMSARRVDDVNPALNRLVLGQDRHKSASRNIRTDDEAWKLYETEAFDGQSKKHLGVVGPIRRLTQPKHDVALSPVSLKAPTFARPLIFVADTNVTLEVIEHRRLPMLAK